MEFFSKLLEYVAFDIIFFSDDLYEAIFSLPDDAPYSEQAEAVGYKS